MIFEAERVRGWAMQCALGAAVLASAGELHGLSCTVAKHGPPTDADTAYLAGDYDKAAELYKAALAKQPADLDAQLGMIHVLLRAGKVEEAETAEKTYLAADPKSAPLVTAKGEVAFRAGRLWDVEPAVIESYKLDPCVGRNRLLFARISEAESKFATAKQQYNLAYQFDPADPEIRQAWIMTLPPEQRIAEMETFLASPNGNDAGTVAMMKGELERWKLKKDQPESACRLATGGPGAKIPFIRLAGYAGHSRAYGLEVSMNDATTRLQLDTRGQGITVYRSAIEHGNLKQVSKALPGAMGKPTYTAIADTIKVGGLEFKNCAVNVIDANSPFDDGSGYIGVDVFADFLVTVDFPMRTLELGPLPARPGASAETPGLETMAADYDPLAGNPTDRSIAPEMKDFSQIYRIGHDLLLPTALSAEKVKLFVPDDQVSFTSISLEAANEVTKTHENPSQEFGKQKVFAADEVSFNFVHVAQKLNGVPIADTSLASKTDGTEISGFLGTNTLTLLTLHIDYRDGLLKADFIPGRGYKFE